MSFLDQSLWQNEMSTSLGWKMENIILIFHPQLLEDSAMLSLVPWELLEASFCWGDSDFGKYKGLRDSMIRMLVFPLLASKKAQHNRREKYRAS